MVKKLLAMSFGLMIALRATAAISFPASDVQYWVGSGSNQAVVVIGWDDNPSGSNFALAWGVRWNGSATAANMLDSIATYDSRVSYAISSGFVTHIGYNDGTLVSGSSASYWCYTLNGGYAGAYGSQAMTNGDLMEVSSSCMFTLTAATAASNPNPTPIPVADTVDAAIAFSDILFWVGSGSDSAVFIVNYAYPDTAFAWGYLFNGTTSAQDMVVAIDAADPRFWIEGNPSVNGDLHFLTNSGDTLGLSPVDPSLGYNFWWTNLNGVSTASGASSILHNGDVFKYGDLNSATPWNFQYGYYLEEAWTKVPTPVTAPSSSTDTPVEATIAASDILFWVGHGSNSAILVVNWIDTALAWGYRFDGSATVQQMMDDVTAVDPRLSYITGSYGIGDILYIDTAAGMTDTLRVAPFSWWSSTNNGVGDMGIGQPLADGDLEKWADGLAGVLVDSVWVEDWGGYWDYIYVYPHAIQPVTVPDTTSGVAPQPIEPHHGPFCGPVGSEGCSAIAADSSVIVNWASEIIINRGPQNISDPQSSLASFGEPGNAVGPATTSNTMDAVSLGDGGSAVALFPRPIRNGEGPDFAVFENSFGDYNLELAFVEVSTDGERYVRFPSTCLTPSESQIDNFGTTDPTNLNNLAGKYRIGYGTPFDLEELRDSTAVNIDSIVYVRVVDVVGSIDPQYGSYDAFGHIINEPWPTPFNSSGFDLTGIAVINELNPTSGIVEACVALEGLYPNPASDRLFVTASRPVEGQLYDLTGRLLATYALIEGSNTLSLSSLPAGLYILRAADSNLKVLKR